MDYIITVKIVIGYIGIRKKQDLKNVTNVNQLKVNQNSKLEKIIKMDTITIVKNAEMKFKGNNIVIKNII